MLIVLSIALTGASAFYLGWNLFSGQLEASIESRLQSKKRKSSNGLYRMSRPVAEGIVLPYSSKIKAEDWRKKMRRRIISAGLEDELDVEELLAFKMTMGFVFPTFLQLYFTAQGNPLSWWMWLIMIAVGFFYPTLWVNGSRARRQEEIKLQLPFVIDLLTLSTEAGLDFIGALQKVVEKSRPGPLVDEIARMIQQIQLGTTRADALRDLGWRIDLQEIASLVAVLVTADQMGSPLGAVLRVQSELIRTQRFTAAEKRGAAASQKLLFPLIFFIMPAVFIMIFGPVILGFIGVK